MKKDIKIKVQQINTTADADSDKVEYHNILGQSYREPKHKDQANKPEAEINTDQDDAIANI